MTAEGIQPTFTSLRPQQASVLAHHFLDTLFISHLLRRRVNALGTLTCTRQFLFSTVVLEGGEKKSHMAPSERKWFCFTIRMNVVIKIGLSLPAREGVPGRRLPLPSMLSFSGCVTLWHVFQPFPFPPFHYAPLLYSIFPSFQPRSAAEEAFALVRSL